MVTKKIWKWLKIIFIIYIAGGIVLYFFQDAILFHPVQLKREQEYDFPQPHTEINIPVNTESNLNIIQFQSSDTITKGVVLYFHGNRKNISWYAKYTPYFTKNGYEVWLIDYPGFGKSTGKFTEQTLYDWALQLYKLANAHFSADSIIIYGKSMGTGIAAQLASKTDCKRLILETPYYDFPSVIRHYLPFYPIDRMLHYKIPTFHYLQNVKAPVTIFHGTDDGVITYSNSERLKPFMKKEDELITIKNGSHNDLYRFKKTVQKLDSLLSL
jgi:pimeloyl-ACP methyl ester carboxylesterase